MLLVTAAAAAQVTPAGAAKPHAIVASVGPWSFTYVNPADDPRAKTK